VAEEVPAHAGTRGDPVQQFVVAGQHRQRLGASGWFAVEGLRDHRVQE